MSIVHHKLRTVIVDESMTDEGIRALAFGRLLDLASPVVAHYRSDFYHDAVWLHAYLEIGVPFYFSFNECGTQLSIDPEIGLYREHKYGCVVRVTDGWVVLTLVDCAGLTPTQARRALDSQDDR